MEQVSPCSSGGVEVGGHDRVRVEGAGVGDQQCGWPLVQRRIN